MAKTEDLVSLQRREKHKVSLPGALFTELKAVCDERGITVSDGVTEAVIVTLIALGRIPAGTYKELESKLYGVSKASVLDEHIAPIRSAVRASSQLRKEREGYNKKPTRLQSDGSQEGGLESA